MKLIIESFPNAVNILKRHLGVNKVKTSIFVRENNENARHFDQFEFYFKPVPINCDFVDMPSKTEKPLFVLLPSKND